MKTKLTIIAIGLWCAAIAAPAQEIVYDPTLHMQTLLNEIENLAKYAEMIDNQVQQINTLTSQLTELKNYNKAFGDPSKILNVTGVNALVLDLSKSGVGQTLSVLEGSSQGADALHYDAGGLYHNVGESFTTPDGNTVARDANRYRQHAAVNKTTKNYADVYADVTARRKALKQDLSATIKKLQSATTASEVQKLTGVLVGLNSELAATDKELDHALGESLVQDAENRNDQDKQQQARSEEQRAEFTQGIKKYGDTIKLSVQAPAFPE